MSAADRDTAFYWADEVRERLAEWAAWSRGNQLVRGSKNVLARMIQRAAGEVPGNAVSGYDFTPRIEAVDKAIARMRIYANGLDGAARRRIKISRRVLMSKYLGNRSLLEIAERLNTSEDYARARLLEAETYIGRVLPDIDRQLQNPDGRNRFGLV